MPKIHCKKESEYKCQDCGTKVTRYSPRCRDCATLWKQKEPDCDRYKGTIDSRFLERGLTHTNNSTGITAIEANA